MEGYFGQILVPVEEVVDIKNGRKTISERKFYPGYVLVEMEMTDDSWHLVKSTPRVSGFIGGTANKPTPISQREADAILQQVRSGVEKPKEGCVDRAIGKSQSKKYSAFYSYLPNETTEHVQKFLIACKIGRAHV